MEVIYTMYTEKYSLVITETGLHCETNDVEGRVESAHMYDANYK